MTYAISNQIANDPDLYARITAAAAEEGASSPEYTTSSFLRWPVAIADDVVAAYASALAAGNPSPGGDEAVITDQMILSVVQAHWPANPDPPA